MRVAGQETEGDRVEGGRIQSVVRAADIVRLLTREGVTSLSVAEASKELGLQRTTMHRYMATLASVSLLQREPGSGRFTLGPLAHEIFSAIMRGKRILAIAPSLLQKLADQTGCTVTLGLWDGSSAMVPHVMYPTSQSDISVRVSTGFRVGPTGAQTIMFLAFLTDPRQAQAVLDDVPAEAVARVERQLSRARSEHFVEVIERDVIAVAAPVFDSRGICATVALISTTGRLGPGPGTEQARLLFDTARRLSGELGHADPAWATPAG
jgi:DNA-binding IclR family transcriptional regulator